jgi:hypothetical protein
MTSTIYVLTNPLFPDYVKIGRAECLYSRLKKLSTSVPKAFKVEFHVEVKDAKRIENELHQLYGKKGWWMNLECNGGREWYKVGQKTPFYDVEDFVEDIKRQIVKLTKMLEN